ncbi:hypothetical protein ACET3Z_014992 [Daucus carota]
MENENSVGIGFGFGTVFSVCRFIPDSIYRNKNTQRHPQYENIPHLTRTIAIAGCRLCFLIN